MPDIWPQLLLLPIGAFILATRGGPYMGSEPSLSKLTVSGSFHVPGLWILNNMKKIL